MYLGIELWFLEIKCWLICIIVDFMYIIIKKNYIFEKVINVNEFG